MPPHHQRDPAGEAVGCSHVADCATEVRTGPNRPGLRSVSNTVGARCRRLGDGGACLRARPGTRRAARPGARPRPAVRHLRPRPVLRHPLRILRLQHLHRRPSSGDAIPDGWLTALRAELALAAARFGAGPPEVDTVFVGGGTPSLLGAQRPGRGARRGARPLRARPRRRGHHRGQSGVDVAGVLRRAARRRLHPGVAGHAVDARRTCWPHWTGCIRRAGPPPPRGRRARAGFEHVNLDLIYGTPGETDDDLLRSVDAAIGAGVDHVSAYALVVEDGTALARRVRRGELRGPRRRRAGRAATS